MKEYYIGEDIPITLSGGNFNLDKDEFELWFYVHPNKVHKLNKSNMKRLKRNYYQGIIRRDDVAGIGTGWVTMEMRLLNVSHNHMTVQKIENFFNIKNSLIGK